MYLCPHLKGLQSCFTREVKYPVPNSFIKTNIVFFFFFFLNHPLVLVLIWSLHVHLKERKKQKTNPDEIKVILCLARGQGSKGA